MISFSAEYKNGTHLHMQAQKEILPVWTVSNA